MYKSILQSLVNNFIDKNNYKFIADLYAFIMRGYNCDQDYELYEKEILINE